MRMIRFLRPALALVCAALAPLAPAQGNYPNRPIKLVVGSAPGGAPDIHARLFADKLSRELKQPVVVENRPGASAMIAAQTLLLAPADGYTLLWVGHSFLTIAPYVVKNLSYRLEQFTPISNVVEVCMMYLSRPSLAQVTSIKDLVSYMAANPGKANFGNPSTGSQMHLLGEKLMEITKTQAQIVTFKSGSEVYQAMGGDFVDWTSVPIGGADLQNIKAGRVRALATTCGTRMPQLPDVPTMTELGYQDMVVTGTYQLFGAKAMPPEIVQTLARVAETIKADTEYQERLEQLVAHPASQKTPEQFARWLDDERKTWSSIVQRSKITLIN